MLSVTPLGRTNRALAIAKRQRLGKTCASLGPRERALLALLLVDRLSIAETALALGWTAAAVTRRYHTLIARFDVAATPRRRAATAARLRRAS